MNVTHDQLCVAPEIALLAAIDHALDLVARLLHVAHPELITDIAPVGDEPTSCHIAPRVLVAIDQLRDALADYHTAVDNELAAVPVTEMPF